MIKKHLQRLFCIAITLSGMTQVFSNAYVGPNAQGKEVQEVRALKEVLKDAKAIDAILAKGYSKNKVKPLPLADDATFVRRAHLQVGGRIPTYQETIGFLESNDPQKQSGLIDRILNSEAYDSHTFNWWADLLRIQSPSRSGGANNVGGGVSYAIWMMNAIRQNMPFDEVARKLITAKGYPWNNGAVGYYMRDAGMPLDNMSNTTQVFLGTQIVCAQCHNHPFEKWSQDNYYGIAAAFTRIGRQKGAKPDEEIIHVTRSGEIKQPRTGQTMKVHLLLTGDVDVPADQDRRRVFADWLVSEENPFFARAAVNRIWGHLMGRGIVEPVDDFRDSNPPSNAALLDSLAEQFTKNGFSRKWAIRTIMSSRVYQLSSKKNDFNADDEIYASHATPRLLSAEQLLDAICQVTDVAESFKGLPAGTRAVALPDPPTDHYFLKVFGQPQREMACQCERSSESNLSQALQMINGPTVHNKLRADNGRIHQMVKAGKKDDQIITTLYLAALARNPVEAELNASQKHIAGSTDRLLALEDVGWAILNSKEFLFQH